MAWQHHRQLLHDRLSLEHSIALLYHDIFSYPLKARELVKWSSGVKLKMVSVRPRVESKDGYYFLYGKGALVDSRLRREEDSRKKVKILGEARGALEEDKDILFAGITGSLAMSSSSSESDIDLMIITRGGRLWLTRLRTLLRLAKLKIAFRRAGSREERDRLCINIWMDENDLVIYERNAYTAHEIAQIVPLISRENTYERFMANNRWILDYWPNAVSVKYQVSGGRRKIYNARYVVFDILERFAYLLQRLYMSRKITREIVTPTRAFFHPFDWSKRVVGELAKRGVVDAS